MSALVASSHPWLEPSGCLVFRSLYGRRVGWWEALAAAESNRAHHQRAHLNTRSGNTHRSDSVTAVFDLEGKRSVTLAVVVPFSESQKFCSCGPSQSLRASLCRLGLSTLGFLSCALGLLTRPLLVRAARLCPNLFRFRVCGGNLLLLLQQRRVVILVLQHALPQCQRLGWGEGGKGVGFRRGKNVVWRPCKSAHLGYPREHPSCSGHAGQPCSVDQGPVPPGCALLQPPASLGLLPASSSIPFRTLPPNRHAPARRSEWQSLPRPRAPCPRTCSRPAACRTTRMSTQSTDNQQHQRTPSSPPLPRTRPRSPPTYVERLSAAAAPHEYAKAAGVVHFLILIVILLRRLGGLGGRLGGRALPLVAGRRGRGLRLLCRHLLWTCSLHGRRVCLAYACMARTSQMKYKTRNARHAGPSNPPFSKCMPGLT